MALSALMACFGTGDCECIMELTSFSEVDLERVRVGFLFHSLMQVIQ